MSAVTLVSPRGITVVVDEKDAVNLMGFTPPEQEKVVDPDPAPAKESVKRTAPARTTRK